MSDTDSLFIKNKKKWVSRQEERDWSLTGPFPAYLNFISLRFIEKEACVKRKAMDLKSEVATVGQLQVYLLLKKADLLAYYDKCKFSVRKAGLSI